MSQIEESQGQLYVPHPKFGVKCRAKRLLKIIEGLNPAHVSAVRRIGFGGLLDLKLSTFPLKHVPLFLGCFNDGSHIFRASPTTEYMLTKHDVHDFFMLPLGPRVLDLVPVGNVKMEAAEEAKELKQLKKHWRDKYLVGSPTGPINSGDVQNDLENDVDGGAEFCKLFVLFAMSTYLCPTSNNSIDLRLLKAVDDVDSINQYDWCSYMLNGCVKADLQSRDSPKFYLGCIPFLMIQYMHRFDFRGETLPHDLPLIKHWSEPMISKRLKEELKSGSLGKQCWSVVKYPRCLHNSQQVVESEPFVTPPRLHNVVVRSKSQAPASSSHKAESRKKSITIDLPPGIEDDEELHEKASDNVHELYLQVQRNSVVFHSWFAGATSRIRSLTSQVVPVPDFAPSQSTQAFFEDERLHRYVDEVVDIANRLRDSVSRAPVLGEQTQTSENNDEGFEELNRGLDACVNDIMNDIGVAGDGNAASDARSVYVPHTGLANHPFMFHFLHPLPCMVVIPENLGCSIDCGSPDPNQILVSKLLRGSLVRSKFVFSLRKEVMDYIFANPQSCDRLQTLVRYSDVMYINHEELLCLGPGLQIISNVIECWSILLNHLSVYNYAPVKKSRCYLGLNHNGLILNMWHERRDGKTINEDEVSKEIFSSLDIWVELNNHIINLDADLVFIPVSSGDLDHYCCACINFGTNQIEFLDNRDYGENFSESKNVQLALTTAIEVGKYLASKGYQRCSNVCNFPITNVDFSWQKHGKPSGNNCAVYTMIHMMLYCGMKFDCPIGQPINMRLYRLEIAATLILSNINKDRDIVLSLVEKFKQSKTLKKIPFTKPRYQRTLEPSVGSEANRTSIPESPILEGPSTTPLTEAVGQELRMVVREETAPLQEETTSFRRPRSKRTLEPNSVVSQAKRTSIPESSVLEGPSKDLQETTPLPGAVSKEMIMLSSVKSSARGNGDGLGCSLPFGNANPVALVVSRTFRAHHKLTAEMPDLRKTVVDYSLLDDFNMDMNEPLAKYGGVAMLTRKDILSILPESNMEVSVMDCWSMLLNRIEKEGFKLPRMAFLCVSKTLMQMITSTDTVQQTQQMDEIFKEFDSFINECGSSFNVKAQWIFIPAVIDGHYFCVCINFELQEVIGLDHQYHRVWNDSKQGKASRVISGFMSDYLEYKGIDQAKDLYNFQHKQLVLKEQLVTPEINESGIFTMMHMFLYEGATFEHENLAKRKTRRLLAIELAASLLLADINNMRPDLLSKLKKFDEDKATIWNTVDANRKLARIIMSKK